WSAKPSGCCSTPPSSTRPTCWWWAVAGSTRSRGGSWGRCRPRCRAARNAMCSLSEPPADGRGGEIDEAILGGPARYTKHEVADAVGVGLQRAESLWQAMGFAHVEDNAVVF